MGTCWIDSFSDNDNEMLASVSVITEIRGVWFIVSN